MEISYLLSLLSAVLCCSQSALWHVQSPSLAGIVSVGHWESQVPCPAAWHVIPVVNWWGEQKGTGLQALVKEEQLPEAWEPGEATGHLRSRGGGRACAALSVEDPASTRAEASEEV